MLRNIYITLRFPAFHKWDKAPKQVDYLQNLHRHVFHVKVYVSVGHTDREIEFHILKNQLIDLCKVWENKTVDSCEQIAEEIYWWMKNKYPHRKYVIDVSEDGENGARLIT